MRLVQVPYGRGMISRPCPDAGPENFKMYRSIRPLSTHWRPASCEEFECDDFVFGFVLTVDTSTELGQRQYHYVTHDKTRKYSMQRVGANMVKFVYGPGNECFEPKRSQHKLPTDRPPFYLVADGDFRGNPRKTPVIRRRVEDWVDDFATHQQKISDAFRRG